MTDTARRGSGVVREEPAVEDDGYAAGADRPLAQYSALMAAYGAAVVAMSTAVRRRGLPLPRLGVGDIVLIGTATHKLSRRMAKDPVTSPLRAPFTRFKGTSGPAELAEEPRGGRARHAIGELVTCPFCLSQWVATGFVFGMIIAPGATRLAASVLTSLTVSDSLQFGYAILEGKAKEK